jgi:hypothetical protein
MSKGRKKISLRDLTNKIPETSDHDAILAEIYGGSDRACALIAVSFLDRALVSLMSTLMSGVPLEDHAPIFEGQTAILGMFSSKIRMCYVLSLISKEQMQHLNRMREIRNHFAHSMGPASFEDQLVAAECDVLWDDTKPILKNLNQLSKPRAKFLMRWKIISMELPARYLILHKARSGFPASFASSMASNILSAPDSKDSNS